MSYGLYGLSFSEDNHLILRKLVVNNQQIVCDQIASLQDLAKSLKLRWHMGFLVESEFDYFWFSGSWL